MEKKVTFRERPTSLVSSPTVRQSFDELVICALCGLKLKDPKMLACQHTFCLSCLKADANKNRLSTNENPPAKDSWSYQCRTCKTTASVNDFADLPNNLHVDTLLEILDTKTGSGVDVSFSRQMSITTESSANNTSIRCNKCEVVLLTDIGRTSSMSEDAGRQSPSSMSATTSTAGFDKGNPPLKSIKCRHCKFYFCHVCWTIHMEQLRDQFQAFDAQLNLVRRRLEKKSENFESRFVDLEENICAFINRKMEKLKVKEQKLLEEARQLMKPEREKLTHIRWRINNLSKSLEETAESTDGDFDKLFMDKHSEISGLIRSISSWGEMKLKFDEGTIEVDTSLKNRGSESEDSPMMELKRVFKVRLLWNRCPHPMGLAETPWNDELVDDQLIYIAGSDSKMVIGIDKKKGRVVRKIQRPAMEYPHSIAISAEREEIAVSDKWANYIFIFNKEGVLVRVIGDKGEVFGCLRSPEGLAIDGDILYVCDTGNDRVQLFDLNTGDVIFQFGDVKSSETSSDGRSKHVELNSPTSIALHRDRIFVLDSAKSRVKVFSKGKINLIGEFGKMGQEKGQFSHPDGIAVDSNGVIYVGDSGNARIQVFDKKFEFVRTIGTRGTGGGKFNWISGLCLTQNNELIVSDQKNHMVQILQ